MRPRYDQKRKSALCDHDRTKPRSGLVLEDTVVLYRPVGQKELDLIRESGFRAFPPRLAWQPIFYPVLTKEYAARIAKEWNANEEAAGYVGYVTRFQVRTSFSSAMRFTMSADGPCKNTGFQPRTSRSSMPTSWA
jgi:hypothetical protein